MHINLCVIKIPPRQPPSLLVVALATMQIHQKFFALPPTKSNETSQEIYKNTETWLVQFILYIILQLKCSMEREGFLQNLIIFNYSHVTCNRTFGRKIFVQLINDSVIWSEKVTIEEKLLGHCYFYGQWTMD